MAEIINLNSFKEQNRHQTELAKERKKIFDRVLEARQSDSAKYNYEFYCLLDQFMRETYPDYAWRFKVWLDKIENSQLRPS